MSVRLKVLNVNVEYEWILYHRHDRCFHAVQVANQLSEVDVPPA